jgi:transcriptional regulator with XRE-family HTH domain
MPGRAVPEPGRQLHDAVKLRTWREARDLSREQVCADLKISFNWLRALEMGTVVPSIHTLVQLAEYYGHDPGELLLPAKAPLDARLARRRAS